MPVPIGYEIWSDVQCNSGTRLSRVTDILDPGPIDEHSLEHPGRIEYVIPRTSLSYQHHALESVFTVVWDETTGTGPQEGFDEYRIRSITDVVDNEDLVKVKAVGIGFDLDRGGFLTKTDANGLVRTDFEVLGRTVADMVGIVLGTIANAYFSGVPSYFSAGTIDRSTERITLPFFNDTGYTALKEIAVLHGAELAIRRNGTTGYLVDILDIVGGSADVIPLRINKKGRNIVRIEHEDSSELQGTRIIAQGGGAPPDIATIADNAFEILSVATNDLTMVEDCVAEDDQLNLMGVYAEKLDGTLIQVTDSQAPNIVTVAGGHGLVAGDVIRLRANSSGDQLIQMISPSAEAGLGGRSIARLHERRDIPHINNEIPNAFLVGTYAGGLAAGWFSVNTTGLATPTENTDNRYYDSGEKSQRFSGSIEDGLIFPGIAVSPQPYSPFYTPQIKVWVESGAVELRLRDVTNDITYPNDISDDTAITQGTGWIDLGFRHGVDHFNKTLPELPTAEFELQVICVEDSTVFYLDAVMLTNTEGGAENYFDGRASNLLLQAANDQLLIRRNSLSKYSVQIYDLGRSDVVRWPNEEITVGGDTRVDVAGTSLVAVPARVQNRKRVLEDPLQTTVTLETEEERLTRLLTLRRRRDVRRQRGEHTKKPRCNLNLQSQLIGGDLTVTWDRTNWARIELRDITGLSGTPKNQWENGVRITITDTTNFELLSGQQTSAGAFPSAIGTIMIEAYNRFGVPGECYETSSPVQRPLPGQCINLMSDPNASVTFCSNVGGPGPIVLNTFLPILSGAAPSIVPGTTRISACHEGASSGGVLDLDGYAGRVKSFISGFHHFNLERVDNGAFNNAWSHSNNVGGNNANPAWIGVAAQDTGASQNNIRVMYAGGAGPSSNPTYQSSGVCCQETTSDYYGTDLQPGVKGNSESGTSYVRFSQGWKRPYASCQNLSNQKLRWERNFAQPWLGTKGFSTTTQTGTGTISMYGTSGLGGGRFDKFEVLSSTDVVEAEFNDYEHPDGMICPGDRYIYDSTAMLAVGVGGVIAVNAAKTLGLLESGFLYEEDWTAVALRGTTIDTTKYTASGPLDIDGGGLGLRMGATDYFLRADVGKHAECVSEAVVVVNSTSTTELAAVTMTGAPDVAATLRLTWNDNPPTVITGTGVGDGVDLANFQQETVANNVLWPATATELTIESLQIGGGTGQACSQAVQVNVGAGCCQFTRPVPGLPPINVDCLLTAALQVTNIDTCAGGTGVSLSITGLVQQTNLCTDLHLPGIWRLDFTILEEVYPVVFPGLLYPVRTDKGPISIPAVTLGGPPQSFTYNTVLTNEDPFGTGPGGGSVRGSDAGTTKSVELAVKVTLVHTLVPSQSGTIQTPTIFGAVYGWC